MREKTSRPTGGWFLVLYVLSLIRSLCWGHVPLKVGCIFNKTQLCGSLVSQIDILADIFAIKMVALSSPSK